MFTDKQPVQIESGVRGAAGPSAGGKRGSGSFPSGQGFPQPIVAGSGGFPETRVAGGMPQGTASFSQSHRGVPFPRERTWADRHDFHNGYAATTEEVTPTGVSSIHTYVYASSIDTYVDDSSI